MSRAYPPAMFPVPTIPIPSGVIPRGYDIKALGRSAATGSFPTERTFDETLVEANGLQAIASHEGMQALRADASAVADRLSAVRCPRLIVPSMPEADRRSVDDVKRFAAELNGFVETFAGRGIRVGYHNHSFE